MDLTPLAVPHTLAHLDGLLPDPPARILEVGCGRGALAVALQTRGYAVTGAEPFDEAASAARERGVTVIEADVLDVDDDLGFDVVLFTRSLHHVEDLDTVARHAAKLLAPGGRIILEEFARERVSREAAEFVYDARALAYAGSTLTPPADADPLDPAADPLERWERERGALAEHPLHTAAAMLDALTAAGLRVRMLDTEMLWRMTIPPAATWQVPRERAEAYLAALRTVELRRLTDGTLPHLGLIAVAHS